jgi:hypothetical protein
VEFSVVFDKKAAKEATKLLRNIRIRIRRHRHKKRKKRIDYYAMKGSAHNSRREPDSCKPSRAYRIDYVGSEELTDIDEERVATSVKVRKEAESMTSYHWIFIYTSSMLKNGCERDPCCAPSILSTR